MWLDTIHERVRQGKHVRVRTKKVWRKSARNIIAQDFHVYRFPSPVLFPGDYQVPFQFTLPLGIPASIFYKNDAILKHPEGKIKYTVQARLARYGTFTKEITYRQVILVRENPKGFAQLINQESTYQLTTWCCLNQGTSKIQGRFEKNMYMPNEVVKADAIISNQMCNLAMTSIRLSVEQEVTIRCGPYVFHQLFTLKEQHEQGVAANDPNDVYRMITIDLNTIRFAPPAAR